MAGIYVHVPFCISRCSYCDFYSTLSDDETRDAFLRALLKEIQSTGYGEPIDSIYLGGGTPSLLSPGDTEVILDALAHAFKIKDDAEITIEANPATFDRAKLRAFRSLGINRLSLGIQSLKDSELRLLGRIHTAEDAIDAINMVSEVFDNYSLDIIYGIPCQDKSGLDHTLRGILTFSPPHISAYELEYHENTLLHKDLIQGRITPPGDPDLSGLYLHLCDVLSERNYVHYEISNFSLEGFHCRHNLNYWLRGDYIGFGPSAHSLIGDRRYSNIADIKEYIDRVERTGSAVEKTILLTERDRIEEELMLGLRTSRGVDRTRFASDEPVLGALERDGLIHKNPERIILTPEGMLVSNAIIVELLERL